MQLKAIIDDQEITLELQAQFLQQAEPFFQKMDQDMAGGWQMGREWVEQPSPEQRAQIAAEKLLTALETENHKLGPLMAGYIMSRMPQIESIQLDPSGEMQHLFMMRETAPEAVPAETAGDARRGLNRMQALALAGKEVSQVFRMGRQWRFSVYNPATGQWEESPAIADKTEAEKMREFAFKRRFDELTGD